MEPVTRRRFVGGTAGAAGLLTAGAGLSYLKDPSEAQASGNEMKVDTGDHNLALAGTTPAKAGSGHGNIGIGTGALAQIDTGYDNIAIGSLAQAVNQTADNNVAVGAGALAAMVASQSVAVGTRALASIVDRGKTVAVGYEALMNAKEGLNVAVGYQALYGMGSGGNFDGEDNVAVGFRAQMYNGTGSPPADMADVGADANTAIGLWSMLGVDGQTWARFNTGCGSQTLMNITTGLRNGAFGTYAMLNLATGTDNSALGYNALKRVVDGVANSGVGTNCGFAILHGSYNTVLGHDAGYTDGRHATTDHSNMTLIGYQAQGQADNVMVFGSAITSNRSNFFFGGIGTAANGGGGVGVIYVANAPRSPKTNPDSGGILYVDGGALMYRGSSGRVTTLAPA